MKKIKAIIERADNGNYSVYIENSKLLNYGIHGVGKTAKEALDDFTSAYDAMKQFHNNIGKKFIEAEFEIQYDVASFLQYYSNILSLAGLERLTGVNQGQLSHYINGRRKPGKRTKKKIATALHEFSKEISQVEFV